MSTTDRALLAFDQSGSTIDEITNGDFSTSENVGHNRVDFSPGTQIRFDLLATGTVNAMKIAAGNANWGGNEMPHDIALYRSETMDGPWTAIGTVAYPNQLPDACVIEFPEVCTRYIRADFLSSQGNPGIVLRQIDFPRAPPVSPFRSARDEIIDCCDAILAIYDELMTDKKTVQHCHDVLEIIHGKGVDVGASLGPLDAQSQTIQESVDGFQSQLQAKLGALQQLRASMSEEAAKVGPIDMPLPSE